MPMTTTATLRTRIATWRERWLAGLTRKGLALVALICLLNALRRSGDTPYFPLDHWLLRSGEAFGTGLIVLLLMTVAIVATYNRAASTPRFRYAALALAIVISSAVGTAILGVLEARGPLEFFVNYDQPTWFITAWARYAVIGLLLAAVFVYFRLAEESGAARHQAELDRALLDQQMGEARLQVLQAQIEPHFLFNTLATVHRLYQTQPASAESMLENLMRYLAVALPQMRATESTLGRETALAEAYLGIQQIRMGRRLAYAIEVPDALREARVPPMMLLTLVSPKVAGSPPSRGRRNC